MSEGELLQLEKARKLDITEDVYYEIIRQKRLHLLQLCCEVGVLSNGADEVLAKKCKISGLIQEWRSKSKTICLIIFLKILLENQLN